MLIDHQRREVYLRGKQVELTDLLYNLLLYLVQSDGRTISEEELDHAVWGPDEVAGSKERVKAGIKALRQALGEYKPYIINIRGKGYAFIPYLPNKA